MAEQTDVIRAPIPGDLIKFGIATISIDGQEIVVLSEDDGYRAIDRWCPHEDGDLGDQVDSIQLLGQYTQISKDLER